MNASTEAAAQKYQRAIRQLRRSQLNASLANARLQVQVLAPTLRDLALQLEDGECECFKNSVTVISAIEVAVESLSQLADHLRRDGRKVAAGCESNEVAQCHKSSPLQGVSASSLGVGEGADRGYRSPSVTSVCTCGGAR